MTVFRRAAMREFAATAAAISVALIFILVTVVLIRLLSQAVGGRVPADAVLALIGFSTLSNLPVVLALSSFIAILLAMSRSYRDSEMVVWFAAGLSLRAWMWPVLGFAGPVAIVVAVLSLWLAPWAQQQGAEFRKRLDVRDEITRVAPGVFRESADGRRVFFVETLDEEAKKVRNVFISALQKGKPNVVVAAEGLLRTEANGERFIVLQNGRRYEGVPGQADYRVMQFAEYAVRIEQKEVGAADSSPRSLSTLALLAAPQKSNAGELVWRLGLPLATVLLGLLAMPLAFVNPRAGRANGLIFAVLVFAVYVNVLGLAQAQVTQGKLPLAQGWWVVHAAMLLLLCVLTAWRWLPWQWARWCSRLRGGRA